MSSSSSSNSNINVLSSFFLVFVIPTTTMVMAAEEWNMLQQPTSIKTIPGRVGIKHYCESWKMNVELNNIRAFDSVPKECVEYIGKYMTSSQYRSDVQAALEQSVLYLAFEFVLNGDDMDAWVFDVDSTLLSLVPYYRNHSFGGEEIDQADLDAWKAQGSAPAIQEILVFFRQIRERGFKIFLISSRPEILRNATEENLVDVGYHGWAKLILRPAAVNDTGGFETVLTYKSLERLKLVGEGYRIWGVVGDQWSSVLTIPGCPQPKRYFKLPNPMYYEI